MHGSVSLQLFSVVCIFPRSMGVMNFPWGSQNYFKDSYLIDSQPTFLFFNLFLTLWIIAILSNGCKLEISRKVPDTFYLCFRLFYFTQCLTSFSSINHLHRIIRYITTILSNGCKPDNFDVKLSFTNIWSLGSNFVESKSFLESNSPGILDLCKTNLDDSVDSGNFSVRGYLPLIQKDSITSMHGLAAYFNEGLLFAQEILENLYEISRKVSGFVPMFSTSFTSLSVLLLFPLSITFIVMHSFWFYII